MGCARLAAALAMAWAAPVAVSEGVAQSPDSAGRVISRVTVEADSSQAYALYLPPGHADAGPWPALVIMDPRGRAMVPLERFRPAAQRLGYVILSSYNTSSDQATSVADSRRAVEAMVNDAMGPRSLDPSRLYFVGFSGTARIAWLLGAELPANTAGVVGSGGGLEGDVLDQILSVPGVSFAYFGATGTGDFNNRIVRGMDALLDGSPIAHRVRVFSGGHQWPPEPVATEAVVWLEVQAQRQGLAPRDRTWLADRYRTELEAAAARESDGRLYDAWLRYRQAAEAFDGLVDVREARNEADRLAATDAVAGDRQALAEWDGWEASIMREATGSLAMLDRAPVPALEAVERAVGLAQLQELQALGDTLVARAAGRVLASLRSVAGFYKPRAFVERGQPEHALRSLELAYRIQGDAGSGLCRWWSALPDSVARSSALLSEACARPDDGPAAVP